MEKPETRWTTWKSLSVAIGALTLTKAILDIKSPPQAFVETGIGSILIYLALRRPDGDEVEQI